VPVEVPLKAEDNFDLKRRPSLPPSPHAQRPFCWVFLTIPQALWPAAKRLSKSANWPKSMISSSCLMKFYDRLVYGVKHVCFPSLPGMRERTILLGGFSKDYAMTGWRIGFACAPEEILTGMLRVHQYTIMSAPTTRRMPPQKPFLKPKPMYRTWFTNMTAAAS
jgi:aminotransferase